MPQTQIACPRCRQMITANIEQLFDVTQDPQAKQRLLGGVSNVARCPHCGYQGRLATPIIYHDNDKELLLTFFPPELGLPLDDQEKVIGPLIKQVMDRLPPERRKAYLLNPIPNLTDPNPPLAPGIMPSPPVPGSANPDNPSPGAPASPSPNAPWVPPVAPKAPWIPQSSFGGNVGPVGSQYERNMLSVITGQPATDATELLLGPVARGTTVSLNQGPQPGPKSPPGGPK